MAMELNEASVILRSKRKESPDLGHKTLWVCVKTDRRCALEQTAVYDF